MIEIGVRGHPSGLRSRIVDRALTVGTASLLVVDAAVHAADASDYDANTGALVSQGTLFRAEAVVAVLVAIALMVRPRRAVWLMALATAASAAGAVVLITYVDVGAPSWLPDLYEPTWATPGKLPSAIAETVAAVLCGVRLVLPGDRRVTPYGP